MPVLRRDDRRERGREPGDGRDDGVSACDGERAAREEVVLQVHREERVVLAIDAHDPVLTRAHPAVRVARTRHRAPGRGEDGPRDARRKGPEPAGIRVVSGAGLS